MNEQKVYRIIAFCFGAYLMLSGVSKFLFVWQFPGPWIKVDGIVQRAYIKSKIFVHAAVVEYRYQIQGQEFFGKSLSPLSAEHIEFSKSSVQHFIKPFTPGAQVDVFVNPHKTDVSSMHVYFGRDSWESLFQFLSFCFGFLLLVYALVGPTRMSKNYNDGGSVFINHISRQLRRPFKQK